METIQDLRKALKPLGYKVKTVMLSWGRHATYVHIESGEELLGNVFTDETFKKWAALFTWAKENDDQLAHLFEVSGVFGLRKGKTR